MLLDLFYEQAQKAQLRVVRRHFYEFVLELHASLAATTRDRPVEALANAIADGIDVLCFDEFQIADVQDAAILPRIFEVLFLRGVSVIVTSNTAPQFLYSGGLNRHVHLPPLVDLMARHSSVLGLGGRSGRSAVDYRRRAEAAEAKADGGTGASAQYICGNGAVERLEAAWKVLRQGRAASSRDLPVRMGRSLHVSEAAGPACRIGFSELCASDRGEADFLALAEEFKTVVLHGVPQFTALEETDMVKRFVKLLDVLYDRKVRLLVGADAPLDKLFEGIRAEVGSGDFKELSWRTALYSADGKAGMAPGAVGALYEAIRASDRAESRLREMRTRRYHLNAA